MITITDIFAGAGGSTSGAIMVPNDAVIISVNPGEHAAGDVRATRKPPGPVEPAPRAATGVGGHMTRRVDYCRPAAWLLTVVLGAVARGCGVVSASPPAAPGSVEARLKALTVVPRPHATAPTVGPRSVPTGPTRTPTPAGNTLSARSRRNHGTSQGVMGSDPRQRREGR